MPMPAGVMLSPACFIAIYGLRVLCRQIQKDLMRKLDLSTGEFFSGPTALEVVEIMKMNPFKNHLSAQEFMVDFTLVTADSVGL